MPLSGLNLVAFMKIRTLPARAQMQAAVVHQITRLPVRFQAVCRPQVCDNSQHQVMPCCHFSGHSMQCLSTLQFDNATTATFSQLLLPQPPLAKHLLSPHSSATVLTCLFRHQLLTLLAFYACSHGGWLLNNHGHGCNRCFSDGRFHSHTVAHTLCNC